MEPIKHVGFGCVALSTFKTVNAALRMLETAYNNGITHFDTAPVYGNGFSEKVLAAFLKNKRDQVTLATKTGLFPGHEVNLPAWVALPLNALSKKIKRQSKSGKITFNRPQILPVRLIEKSQVQASIQSSMRRTATDYFDYMLLHEALPNFLSDEALDYLQELKKTGIISKLGIAASSVNMETLSAGRITSWDALQYENAVQYQSDHLTKAFPGHEHICHSLFKTLLLLKKDRIDLNEAPGILMARSYLNNPNGRILFSTTSVSHLKNNLHIFHQYAKLPKTEVEKIITHAIS